MICPIGVSSESESRFVLAWVAAQLLVDEVHITPLAREQLDFTRQPDRNIRLSAATSRLIVAFT
jgi:hypothetical protein